MSIARSIIFKTDYKYNTVEIHNDKKKQRYTKTCEQTEEKE